MEKQHTTKEFMSTDDLADFLGRTPGAIRNLTLRRKIPYRKTGGRLVFLRSEIVDWIKQSPGVRLTDLNLKD